MEKPIAKKVTLRERRKAQPLAKIYFSEEEKQTIAETVARGLTVPQTKIFFYQCQALGLNPLLNEICAVTYRLKDGSTQMSIQVMRDGFLKIAHRSGKFAGMESGVKWIEGEAGKMEMVGWAKVFHKDFQVPLYQEADFKEYAIMERGGKPTLWAAKPRTMIKKVAESMALRKAFNVAGVYATEEMEKEIVELSASNELPRLPDADAPATEAQIATIRSLDPEYSEEELKKVSKQIAAEIIKKLVSQPVKVKKEIIEVTQKVHKDGISQIAERKEKKNDF
ncbi:MAG: phage recombination protein Bet [Candidatus Omnitrophica bacterium]|nr:phage recombination protein Bet [Candidatus Omnitrophota bacterium]